MPSPQVSRNGMVASVHPLASHAGLQVLKNGGNAIDAAVATSAVMGVVAPQYSGLGGGGFILVHLFGTSKTVAIDCREVAPAKAHGDLFKIADVQSLRALGGSEAAASANRLGYKAVGVPGNLAGLCSILDQYGTKSLKELLQSAVEIAENGFPVSRRLGNILAENIDDAYAKSKLFQATGKIYLRDGRTYAVNEMMTNRDLARTLQRIGEEGMDVFYEGDIAEAIDQDMAEHDGLVTKADLRDYEPKSKKPILGNYRGYDLLTMPPPGGGVTIVEILNILEEFDLKKLGHNTMQSIKVISETMMQAFADKSMNVADPDFAELGYEHLLSKDYAKRIARKLDLADSLPRWGTQQSDRGSTVHFSVIDKDRNVVAMTESIECYFGSGVVVDGTGFLLNDQMHDFDLSPGSINSIEPRKRPASSMAPTIILKDGEPFMVLGSCGGPKIISSVIAVINNVIDYGMNLQDAVDAPRFHAKDGEIDLDPAIPAKSLKDVGHKVLQRDEWWYFGAVQAVMFDNRTSAMYGVADPRRDGDAEGF